jgi:hypothetical protein
MVKICAKEEKDLLAVKFRKLKEFGFDEGIEWWDEKDCEAHLHSKKYKSFQPFPFD